MTMIIWYNYIAIGIYFIVNKLLIIDENARRTMEINIFFTAWLFSYISCYFKRNKKAWKEQLLFAAIIFMILLKYLIEIVSLYILIFSLYLQH